MSEYERQDMHDDAKVISIEEAFTPEGMDKINPNWRRIFAEIAQRLIELQNDKDEKEGNES